MLCRPFANEFDNRMLQMKKQLRGNRVGFCTAFPLLYSKFIREEISGHTERGRPNRRQRNARQSFQQETLTIRQQLLNP
jgi:hypothetical protein